MKDKYTEWSDEKMMDDSGRGMSLILFGMIGLVVLMMFFGAFYTIDAGQRGVLLTFGSADPVAKEQGLHFKIPFAQSIVKMEVRTMKYEAEASAASKDLQVVTAKIATNYHLVPARVPEIYGTLGPGYADRVIAPIEQEAVKATTAKFTAEELVSKREETRLEIKKILQERLVEKGIIVEEVSIVNFDFSKSFNEAIEAKVTAEQLKLKAERDLERIKVEAEQKIAQAKAEAESIKIQSAALRENQDILQLRAIEKWNGVMPLYTGEAMPFINIK